jgi:hypothetical protein
MILIGICGQKGSGKDTMADYLVQHFGFEKWSYAGPLKQFCQDLFLLTEDQCNDPLQKEEIDPRWNKSPRQLFQLVGTDWVRRDIDCDFWVKRMKTRLDRLDHNSRVVVSDVRFENERDLIVEKGGIVCGVYRKRIRLDTHASEQEMETFLSSLPILFDNNTDLETFYSKIREWYTLTFI